MTREKGFILNIVLVIAIVVIAFLSQQPYFRVIGRKAYLEASKQGNIYWSKTTSWFQASIYPRASGEASKAQDSATKEITTQKDNLAQNIWDNIKNYFAQKFSGVVGTKVK